MATPDEAIMQAALDAARGVAGHTGDNPPVGCVIVYDARIVASGATQRPGGAHAEVMAVQAAVAAGTPMAEAEVFVILEPCAFTGRTPPCSRLLVGHRPRRVVVGVRDPHPLVHGRGIAELAAAGIPVVEGVLADPIREFLAEWLERFADAP